MRSTDVDLQQAIWRISDTKARRPHWLPLPRPAVTLIQALPRVLGNPYIFPGRDGRGHLVNISKAWTRIRTHAGLVDVRIHDLRRILVVVSRQRGKPPAHRQGVESFPGLDYGNLCTIGS
jgi:integrase